MDQDQTREGIALYLIIQNYRVTISKETMVISSPVSIICLSILSVVGF